MLLFTTLNSSADMPEEGFELENQASARYYSINENKFINVLSNIVKTTIMPVQNLLLTPKEIKKNVTESDEILFIHELRNTGNTTVFPFLNWGNKSDDDFDLLSLAVYLDVNKNGMVDFSDLQVSSNNPIEIKTKEIKQLIIKGYVPSNLNQQNTIANIFIKAEIPLENIMEEAIDTAKYLSGPFIEITPYADALVINRGQIAQFSFLARNIGTYKANPTEIYLDGVLSSKVYIKSRIPLNSTFEGFKYQRGNQYYHLAGESEFSFHKGPAPEKDKLQIDNVIFIYDEIEVGEELESGYFVKSNINAYDKLEANFSVNFKESGVIDNVESVLIDVIIKDDFNALLSFTDNENEQYILTSKQLNLVGLELNAGVCNTTPGEKDIISIILETELLGDREEYTMEETDINTGFFLLSDVTVSPVENNIFSMDGILSVKRNDKIMAKVVCGETILKDVLYVEPINTVINSSTNQPVSNIVVSLEKVQNPLLSVSNLGSKSLSNVQFINDKYETITDENGNFDLPILNVGYYMLTVSTINTSYIFPSLRKIENLTDENRFFDKNISYGKTFYVEEENTVLGFDIPIDNTETPGLFINKKIDKNVVEIGDLIEYKIDIYNNTGIDLVDIKLKDIMPLGVKIIKDSAFIDDINVEFKKDDNQLTYVIKNMQDGSKAEVIYKAQVLLSSIDGNKTNTVQAESGGIYSNLSKASFSIKDRIFNDSGLLIGKVFMDCNKNRVQEKEEIGIPNVRLYLDTGHFVETDVEGKYHFDNLNARTYSVVIDKSTLPRGHIFHKTKSRNNNDPYGMFVDIKGGDLFKANFTEGLCHNSFKNLVTERRNKILGLSDKHGSRKYDDSSKIKNYLDINREQDVEKKDNEVFESDIDMSNNDDFILNETVVDINEIVKDLDNSLDFINIKSEDIIPLQQLSVQVKGKIGSSFKLKVNNIEIPKSRVGQKHIVKTKSLEIWKYVAVRFEPGINTLTIEQLDPFGNIRGKKEIKIVVPGDRAKIQIIVPKEKQSANGFSETKIKVKVVDKNNNKITSRTPVTLNIKNGEWDVKDLNENEAGIQTFIKKGEETFKLISPLNIQEDIISVESGVISAQAKVRFKPNLKELLVSGIMSFEKGDYVSKIEEGDNNYISLFMQGRIKGDLLLSLNYDNKRDKKFIDAINPDSFYKIYGDASKKSFEGETYKNLYVKLENETAYMLYGNFTPRFSNNDMKIINYQKTLPGLDFGLNLTENLKIKTFIGVDGDKTKVKTLKSKGISGPYNLLPDINENTYWTVYIIEKDINGEIIKKTEQSLYQDYIIDELNNSVYFNKSINQFNGSNSIYVSSEYYEIDGANPILTKGVTAEYVKDDLWFNANYIKEDITSNEIIGAFVKKKLKNSQIEMEYGQIISDNKDAGKAGRIKYKLDLKDNKLKVELKNIDKNYINKYSNTQSGSSSALMESYHVINNTLKYKQNAEFQKKESVNTSIIGYSGLFHQTISSTLNTEFGVKYIKREQENSNRELNILSNSWNYNPNWLARSQWGLLYDVDVKTQEELLEVNVEYYLRKKSKVYVKQKLINDLDSTFGINSDNKLKTAIGVSYEQNENGNIYSELRLRDTESGENLTTIFGFNQGIDITEKIKLDFGYEREDEWSDNKDTISVFSGMEWKTDDNDIYKLKIEYSDTVNENIYGFKMSQINRVDKNLSLYNKLKYEYIENNKTRSYNRVNFESNYIYRPIDNDKLNLMFGYEFLSDNQFENEETHYLKTHLHYDVTTNIELLSHIGYKKRPIYSYDGLWITNRLIYNATEKLDVGLRASTLIDETYKHLYGLEVGYQVWSNIWVSGGYNFKEIDDKYYNDVHSINNHGYYAKLRIKLDEGLFFWLK